MSPDKKLLTSCQSVSKISKYNSVKCIYCGNNNCIKNGGKGKLIKKQNYYCKDCKQQFIMGIFENSRKPLPAGLTCSYCGHHKCVRRGKDSRGDQKYKCQECGKYFKENYIRDTTLAYSLEIGEDVWDAKNFGLTNNIHRKRGEKINFALFKQLWLRAIIKNFVLFQASTGRRYPTILGYCNEFSIFSRFLLERRPDINDISEVDRSVIVDYLNYLSESHKSRDNIVRKLGVLRTLFEIGTINNWFEIPHYLVRNEDFPKFQRRKLPRYIPQEVLQQLNSHLDALPEPVMRMVLVIQECGLRVGELLVLNE